MKKDNSSITPNYSNDSENNNEPEIHVRIIGPKDLDPRIIEFLPPEIRDIISQQKNISNGSDGQKYKNKKKEEEQSKPVEKIKYNFKMTNAKYEDLQTLVEKLKKAKTKKWSMLLYGQSGTGKSFLSKYIAQELGIPFIKKKCSEITDKFVGETEKNIRNAFAEAAKKKALLCFDEADSFLWDRTKANQDFQAAGVNEMLCQMEDHEYPVIFTTNLRGKIDKAANRRILFKVEFDYMTKENIKEGIKTYFGKQFKLTKEQLDKLKYLTAGDFRVVKEKAAVLDNGEYTNESIYKYLLHEQEEKDVQEGSQEIVF